MSARCLSIALFAFFAIDSPAYAQLTVTLGICNAGKVDVDAYFVRSGSVATAHIKPADCGVLAKTEGTMTAGILGFGFPDAKGQWGGARRSDVAPVRRGIFDETGALPIILDRSKQRQLTVKHGLANVTIPGLWATEDVSPACSAPATTANYSPLPPNAPRWQRIERDTANFKASIDAANGAGAYCYSVQYNFTVIPYPDSLEVGTDTRCDPCNAVTPEQRAENDRKMDNAVGFIAGLPGFNSTALGRAVVNMADAGIDLERQEVARRNEIAKGPYSMIWNDLSTFITSAFDIHDKPPLMANRYIILRATVGRVAMPNPGAQFPVFHVYFKDAITKPVDRLPGDYFINGYVGTDQAFGVCTSDENIFRDMFGPNFSTAMVGKTVELQGEVNRGACGTGAGIQVTLTRQFKEVKPGITATQGRPWVPVLVPVAPAKPATAVSPTPSATREAPAAPAATRAAAVRDSSVRSANQPSANPATPVPAAAPAPSPRPAATPAPAPPPPQKDPRISNVIQYLKSKLPEAQILQILKNQNKPIQLTGPDRAELEDAGASEVLIAAMIDPSTIPLSAAEQRSIERRAEQQKAAERFAACQDKAKRDFPNDLAAQRRALAQCQR